MEILPFNKATYVSEPSPLLISHVLLPQIRQPTFQEKSLSQLDGHKDYYRKGYFEIDWLPKSSQATY